MNGTELIAQERAKKIYNKTAASDVLPIMASCYCLPEDMRKYQYGEKMWPTHWPIGYAIFDFKPEDRIKEPIKAGALIAAEIDRLQEEGKQ